MASFCDENVADEAATQKFGFVSSKRGADGFHPDGNLGDLGISRPRSARTVYPRPLVCAALDCQRACVNIYQTEGKGTSTICRAAVSSKIKRDRFILTLVLV
jgi:hypothetical protein